MIKTFKCCVVMVVLGVVGNFSVEAGITDKLRDAMKGVFDDGKGGMQSGGMHNKGKNDEKEKDDKKGDKEEDEDVADKKDEKDKNTDRFKGDIVASATDDEGNITTVTQTEDGNLITQVTDEDGNLVSTVVKTNIDGVGTQVVTTDEVTGKVTVDVFDNKGTKISSDTHDSGYFDDQGNLLVWQNRDDKGRETASWWRNDDGSTASASRDPDTGNTNITYRDKDNNVTSTRNLEFPPEGGSKSTLTDTQTGEVKQILRDDEGTTLYSDTKNSDGVEIRSFERAPDGSSVSTWTYPDSGVQWIDIKDKDGNPVSTVMRINRDDGGTQVNSTDEFTGKVTVDVFDDTGTKISSDTFDGSLDVIDRDPDTGITNITYTDKNGNYSTVKLEFPPEGGMRKTIRDYRTGVETFIIVDSDGKTQTHIGPISAIEGDSIENWVEKHPESKNEFK